MAGWNDPAERLDRPRLQGLFVDIDWQLGKRTPLGEPPVELFVCGGAAMCFHNPDRGTGDVDIMYPSMTPELLEATRTVARRKGLRGDWMNDGGLNTWLLALVDNCAEHTQPRCTVT